MKQIIVDNLVTTYYISENGDCFNEKTGKMLKGQISNSGYLNFNLTLPDGRKKRLYAHRLVATAYIKKENAQQAEVNHKDGNKLNNSVNNLEWVTHTENIAHAVEAKLISTVEVYCFDENKNFIKKFNSVKEAADELNISISIIRQELHKKVKTLSGGLYWNDSLNNNFDVKEYSNTGKAKTVCQFDLNGNFIAEFSSTGQAAKAVGVKAGSHIGECCRGKIKTYKGYIWKYKEDIV